MRKKKASAPPPLEPGGFEGVEWVKPTPVPEKPVKRAKKATTTKAVKRVKKDLPAPPITPNPRYLSVKEVEQVDKVIPPLPPRPATVAPVVVDHVPVATTPRFAVRSARLSQDGLYRYWLWRTWDAEKPTVVFAMLNPSTADGMVDDATIVRSMNFADTWGFGRLVVINLYGYRATKPEDLWKVEDPVGPDNDYAIAHALSDADRVVCAWGTNAKADRVQRFHNLAGATPLHALHINKDGSPKHPLYVPADTEPLPYYRKA